MVVFTLDRVTSGSDGTTDGSVSVGGSDLTVTINDSDDTSVRVLFGRTYQFAHESSGSVDILVRISASPVEDVTVDLRFRSADDTASIGDDFLLPSRRYVTFAADTTTLTQEITVPIVDNVDVELTEYFFVKLQLPIGAPTFVTIDQNFATLTVEIVDDDAGTLGFVDDEVEVNEGDSFRLGIGVTAPAGRSCPIQFPIDVHLSYTDPDGALSPIATSADVEHVSENAYRLLYDSCQITFAFNVSTRDVSADSEVVFSLDKVTLAGETDHLRPLIVEPSTLTVRILDSTIPGPGEVSVTIASNPSGRTVTVDGTDRTAPHNAIWDSGTSHTLDVPSPQSALGNNRFVFSSWSHGGSQSQSVTPTGDTTYTANFTQQHFLSTRTEPKGIGVTGGGRWYDLGSTATVGPAPSIDGYEFSHWRKGGRGGQNVGTDPAGVSITIDVAPFLVEAVYTVSSTSGPPSVNVVSPLDSRSLEPGDRQSFSTRATDPDNNISSWEWFVNGQSQVSQSIVLTGDVTKTFSHTFPTAGIHSVRATFTDVKGNSDSVLWTVQVDGPTSPSVSIVSPQQSISLEQGDSQAFQVKATDADDNISAWEWSVNGERVGGQTILGTGSISRQFTYTFLTEGSYVVEARFTDAKRGSDSVTWSVSVLAPIPANSPPSVSIVSPLPLLFTLGPSVPDDQGGYLFFMRLGESQTFEVLVEDSDNNLAAWEWHVNGSKVIGENIRLPSPSTRMFTHVFYTPGDHEVVALFTDSDGATGSASWRISVSDEAMTEIPDEVESDESAYISDVRANRALESGENHVVVPLRAYRKGSCDFLSAGTWTELDPFSSPKQALWVRLVIVNPTDSPIESPIGMKIVYRDDDQNVRDTLELREIYSDCRFSDSPIVRVPARFSRVVYFALDAFSTGLIHDRHNFIRSGHYEYFFRYQEPYREIPDLTVEVTTDEDEIQAPALSGTIGAGTQVFWKFPKGGYVENERVKKFNEAAFIANTICMFIPYCFSPLVYAPDFSDVINVYHKQRVALLTTAEARIKAINSGQNYTDVRTEWNNRTSDRITICSPDNTGGAAPPGCSDALSVSMAFDRATAVLEVKAPGSTSCPTIETTSSDISIGTCEYVDGDSIVGVMWNVYGVGNKIDVFADRHERNYRRERNFRIVHQTDLDVNFSINLELGPFRGRPYLDPDGGIIDYSEWRSDPDSMYWVVISTDSDSVHLEGGGIQDVYGDGLVLHECGQGNVNVDVVAPTAGNYYVEVFDDFLGKLALEWEWDSTRSQSLSLAGGEQATMAFDVCPDSLVGVFEFRLYRQSPGSGDYLVVDKLKRAFSPYDADGDVSIGRTEVLEGVFDFFAGNLTRSEILELIAIYFG